MSNHGANFNSQQLTELSFIFKEGVLLWHHMLNVRGVGAWLTGLAACWPI